MKKLFLKFVPLIRMLRQSGMAALIQLPLCMCTTSGADGASFPLTVVCQVCEVEVPHAPAHDAEVLRFIGVLAGGVVVAGQLGLQSGDWYKR